MSSQTHTTEFFTKTVSGLQPLTIFAKKSIIDILQILNALLKGDVRKQSFASGKALKTIVEGKQKPISEKHLLNVSQIKITALFTTVKPSQRK